MDELKERDHLTNEVVELIINAVHLQHLDKSTISETTALTVGGLSLDSIDVLEIVVAVEHHFKVKVSDAETGKKYFRTVGTVVDFIIAKKNGTLL